MNAVQPEELSALLDGELGAERAREVEMQIASDPGLRAEFEALSAMDVVCRAAAASAEFALVVQLPANTARMRWLAGLVASIAGLIILRIFLKLAGSDALAIGLPAVSLILLLVAVVYLLRAERGGTPGTFISAQEQTS